MLKILSRDWTKLISNEMLHLRYFFLYSGCRQLLLADIEIVITFLFASLLEQLDVEIYIINVV